MRCRCPSVTVATVTLAVTVYVSPGPVIAFCPAVKRIRPAPAVVSGRSHRGRYSHERSGTLAPLTVINPLHSISRATEETEDAGTSDGTELTDETKEQYLFLARTKALCAERNLPLEKVKNARDLASCAHSPVIPNRVYRTGRVSDATDADIELLFGELGFKTLVDLRSPTELKEDPTMEKKAVFENFTSIVWKEKGRKRGGAVTELEAGESRIRSKPEGTSHIKDFVEGVRRGVHAATHEPVDERTQEIVNDTNDDIIAAVDAVRDIIAVVDGVDESIEEEEDCILVPEALPGCDGACPDRKERHFVSLMNEFKYVRGTLSKLRKRDIARVLLQSPAAAVSKRARDKIKTPFLDEINDGGLPMLNELVLRFGAPGIRYVLELCADRTRHPVAFYCTAGKDRTGIIAAIILAVLGVPDEDIVEDYSLSANVYAEMNDHKAMVGALSQRNLNPKTFLGAPRQVMLDTLVDVRENYGSVKGYLDWIGFGAESQENLRKALMDES